MDLAPLKDDDEELCGAINAESDGPDVVFCQKATGHYGWHTAALRVLACDYMDVEGQILPLTQYETWP